MPERDVMTGYLIMAARKAGLNLRTEEKLVEALGKVMKEQLPADALEVYEEAYAAGEVVG